MLTRTMYGMRPVLMMAEGDGGGGGGGGGDGKGGGGGGAAPFSEEQNKALNSAIASHMKRFEAKIPTVETLKEGLGIGALSEQIAALAAGKGAGADDGKGGGDGKGGEGKGTEAKPPSNTGGGQDPETKRAIAKLQEDNDNLKKRLAKEDEEKRAAQEKAARNEERSVLTDALRKVGVPDGRIGGAVAMLLHDRRVLARNAEGQVHWPVRKGGADGYDDPLTVEQGAEEWAKTEEGKSYLPPADAGGSGQRGGKPPKAGEKTTPQQDAATIAAWAFGGGGNG